MEDFVPYELAVKLKEKGFKEKCIAYYWEKINEYTPSFVVEDNMPEDGLNILDLLSNHNQSEWSPFIDAPTISQVLKWLREEKKINICIDIYDDGWFFDIASFYKEDTGVYEIKLPYKSSNVTPDYDSFEQAALAGIEYAIDNLI